MLKHEELSEQATIAFREGNALVAKKLLVEALKAKVKYVEGLDITQKTKDEEFVIWVNEFGLESAVLDSKL